MRKKGHKKVVFIMSAMKEKKFVVFLERERVKERIFLQLSSFPHFFYA
jgi:hypothetical protein